MPGKRACDACNVRKIKCDRQQPCQQCSKNHIDCTYLKVHRKSGPRGLRSSIIKVKQIQQSLSQDAIEYAQKVVANTKRIPLKVLRICVEIYSKRLYGIWPLISKQDLFTKFEADQDNIELYTLVVALCAATLSDLQLEITDDSVKKPLSAAILAAEAVRARSTFDYMENVNLNSILTSYFLHMYYGRQENRDRTAIFYIREAITFAHLNGLHTEAAYANHSINDQQTMRKLYFLLFMTERYLCINCGLPVVLEPIKLPSTEYEDQPDAVSGFLNLVRLFSTPDKSFFDRWTKNTNTTCSRDWLSQLQKRLEIPLKFSPKCDDDIQKVDIVVSQHWIRALTWKLSIFSGHVPTDNDRVMSMTYPIEIAKDLLIGTSRISSDAFEVHGPGMEVKIFEILNSLTDVILCLPSEAGSMVVSPHDILRSVISLFSSIQVKNRKLRELVTEKIDLITKESLNIPSPVSFSPTNDKLLSLPSSPTDSETNLLMTTTEDIVSSEHDSNRNNPLLDNQSLVIHEYILKDDNKTNENNQISEEIMHSLSYLEEILVSGLPEIPENANNNDNNSRAFHKDGIKSPMKKLDPMLY